jgi:hypothetical protein
VADRSERRRGVRRRLGVAVALAGVLAAGAAGCGGSSGPSTKETFTAGYKAQRTALNKVSDQIGQVLNGADGKTDEEVVTELRDVEGRYRALLVKLEALKAPDDLKADFGAVTKSARVLDDDLVAITGAAGAHDAASAKTATEQLVAHIPALKTAAAKLVKALGLPPIKETADASPTGDASGGKITASYDTPSDAEGRFAKEILQLGGTDGIAAGLSHSFVLPVDMRIHAVNGFVGPNYDPSTKTITLSYGFVNYVGDQLVKNFPELRKNQNELGKELAAVDGFVLLHEFGHALIDVFSLPVLGKEEDAADSVATVFLTQTVKHGAQYAFDAAKFFNGLSARQRKLAPAAYWDEHSLDKQRAYSIVCWIAGATEEDYTTVSQLGILSDTRLQRCPSEYQQKVRSWDTLLQPHVRGS